MAGYRITNTSGIALNTDNEGISIPTTNNVAGLRTTGVPTGSIIFNTADSQFYGFNGTSWVRTSTSGTSGSAGTAGSSGTSGTSGSSGTAGTSGSSGTAGTSGIDGPQGIQGPQGPQGPIGPQGIQGPIGPQGVQGPGGTSGSSGTAGTSGSSGTAGTSGTSGIQGPQGQTGPQGSTGPQGVTGPQGNQGPIGPQGVQGPGGTSGTSGNSGTSGTSGGQGPQGPQGPIGPQGLQGPQGAQGPIGPQGFQGPSGTSGTSGGQGPGGSSGTSGTSGAQGPAGTSGTSGTQGPQGPAGPGVSGTTNYVAKFTSSSAIGNSQIFDNGTNVGIGTNSPSNRLDVVGGLAYFTQAASVGSAFRWGSYGTAVSPDTMLCMNQLWNGSGWTILNSSLGTTAINLGSAVASPTIRFETGGANTQATTKMIIMNNGYVGVGTTNATAPMVLETAGNTTDGIFYSTFTINNTGSNTFARIRFDRSGSARWGLTQFSDDTFRLSNLNLNGTGVADDTSIYVTNASNVGIGRAPSYKLDVNGTLRIIGVTQALTIDGGTGALDRGVITTHVDRQTQIALVRAGVGTWGFDITSGGLAIFTGQDTSTNIMTMGLASGNVGIGTTPSVRFHVSGASIISNNTQIDPQSYANQVVSGGVGDTQWRVTTGIAGNAGTGHNWGLGSNGGSFYFGYGNGSANNTMQTFMRVDTTRNVAIVPEGGNLGVGMTPSYRLDVTGPSTNGQVIAARFNNPSTGSSAYNEINIVSNDATLRIGVVNTAYSSPWTGGGAFFLSPAIMRFGPYNNYVLTLGNDVVGIGTESPAGRLDVRVSGAGTWDRFIVTNTALWGDGTTQYVTIGAGGAAGIMINNPHIVWNSTNSASALRMGRSGGVSTGAYYEIGTGANDNFFIAKNSISNGYQFYINSSGNIGIGTTDPSFVSGTYPNKMYVKGSSQYFGVFTVENDINTGDVNHGIINLYNSKTAAVGDDARIMFTFKNTDGTVHPRASMGAINAGNFAASLQFNTRDLAANYTEKMRLTYDGNLGIGTASPGAKVEIYNGDLWLNGASESVNPEIRLIDGGGIGVAGAKIRYGNSDGNLYIEHMWDTTTSGIFFRNRMNGPAISSMSIVNGRVGIGTTTPNYKLQVVDGDSSMAYFGPNTTWSSSLVVGAGTNKVDTEIAQVITTDGNLHLDSANNSNAIYMQFYYSGDIYCMGQSANATGKFAIGTTSPSAKFQVNYSVGTNGSNGLSDYGIVTYQTGGASYQATIGAIHAEDGYANLNLGGTLAGGSLRFWHISRRQSTDTYPNSLQYYHYNGSSFVQRFIFTQDGDFRAGADIVAYASSDRRLKDNLTRIEKPLEKVSALSGYSFDWNSNQTTYSGRDYGIVAQEVEEVLPEIVTTRDNGYKAVKYEKLVPVLIEAIKELNKKIEAQDELIKSLLDR